ncbi:DUF4198 domain-containing protein [Caulobacter endophyticus]|uniref:DUF4198 domain-containing protein n=1 Tax=Caulobacter endophyticus TaxID=2172652 RepID=UPI00240F8722|nr:DUF4198 domain-containing protein [Caulobacter endophyticus]MDG2529446.1 DUF4198 domain-containing protein [Caulobacter endophyticus]
MTLRKRLLALTAATVALTLPLAAHAHRAWFVPSATILSGEGSWVTVDAAISNELFYPDHRAMRVDGVVITTPDGTTEPLKNAATGQYRSVFDVELAKPGTYKIGTASNSVMASWTENGAVKRFRGSADDFAKQVPAGAADLKTIKSFNRNETFVTRGAPTDTVLKPTGKGLELVPVTHPNDLVATEAATFKFLIDGKPAADLEVTIVPGNSRYRATPGEIKVKTGADGAFKVTLPEAGMYWMNASVRTGETGRGGMGGPPGGPGGQGGPGGPGGGAPGGQPQAPTALAGNGFSASYTATLEAQRP